MFRISSKFPFVVANRGTSDAKQYLAGLTAADAEAAQFLIGGVGRQLGAGYDIHAAAAMLSELSC
jgi:hypothetical protein